MKFNLYLKACRKKYKLTQEELVQELYNYNEVFLGLDIRTLSRWERGSTHPPASKQVHIIKVFQKHSKTIFPYFDSVENNEIEDTLCKVGVNNIIGKHKVVILDFPAESFQMDSVQINQLRHAKDINQTLSMPFSLFKNITKDIFKLTETHFKEWSLHPSNNFWISEFKHNYLGSFFTLRLKEKSFEAVMNFSLELSDITVDDFASFDEEGRSFIFMLHAYNKKLAAMFFIRYYAHLIANQDNIIEIGVISLMEDGRSMSKRLNLKRYKDTKKDGLYLTSQRASLDDVLINESVFKMVFQKQECPEDSN